MLETLLCSQLFQAENPHCLRAGKLNERFDEEDGGVTHVDRLSRRYNALKFTAPDSNNGYSSYSAASTLSQDMHD